MAMTESVGVRKLALLAAAAVIVLSVMGCAGTTGPLSSHGAASGPIFTPDRDPTAYMPANTG
jgi:hypothetical protein